VFAIRTILHPTDLSDESRPAFHLACALARDHGARLVVFSAYPPPLTGSEMVDRDRPDGIGEDLLAKLRVLKPDGAVTVEYRVAEGRAAEAILEAAADVHADLIVMGTHGRSGLGRALMGSVAEAVNRGAVCPVLTVRPSATPA
jgi:nucleotide-binding universal stress UspA family protein